MSFVDNYGVPFMVGTFFLMFSGMSGRTRFMSWRVPWGGICVCLPTPGVRVEVPHSRDIVGSCPTLRATSGVLVPIEGQIWGLGPDYVWARFPDLALSGDQGPKSGFECGKLAIELQRGKKTNATPRDSQ
jgi:hypothetical protein